MFKKFCFVASVFLMLAVAASAADVPVFESGAFVRPWVADPCTVLNYDVVNAPDLTPSASVDTTGGAWTIIQAAPYVDPCDANNNDPNDWIKIGAQKFLDFDIYFNTTGGKLEDSIMGMSIEVNGVVTFEPKWEAGSLCIINDGYAQGFSAQFTTDSWQHFKLVLDTPYSGTWAADPCVGDIRFQYFNSTGAEVYLDNVVFNNTLPSAVYSPTPAKGATGVGIIGAEVSWLPANDAVTYKVYISKVESEVTGRTVPAIDVAAPTTSTAVSLGLDATYYWAVDVVNSVPSTTSGELWSFATEGSLLVESFNQYIDDAAMKNAGNPDQYWVKAAAADIVLETRPAYISDGNSVSLHYYSDLGGGYYGEYGEAVCKFNDEAHNWSAYEIKSLSVEYRGELTNDEDDVYLRVKDSDGDSAIVRLGDTSLVTAPLWGELNFDMTGLGSGDLDMDDVVEFAIGVGSDPFVLGANGFIYLDNIRLYPSRCISSMVIGDLTSDCTVDGHDLAKLAKDWLYDPCTVTEVSAEEPATAPLAYYTFEEGQGDLTVNLANPGTYDATMKYNNHFGTQGFPQDMEFTNDPNVFPYYWDPPRRNYDANGVLVDPNQAIPGNPNFVWDPNGMYDSNCMNEGTIAIVPEELFDTYINKQITISVWIAGDPCGQPSNNHDMVFQGECDNASLGQQILMAHCPSSEIGTSNPPSEGGVSWRAGLGFDYHGYDEGGDEEVRWLEGSEALGNRAAWTSVPWNNDPTPWNHYAFVKDASVGFMRIYWNGDCVATENTKFQPMVDVDHFIIGQAVDRWHEYTGKIDEFHIYDYALSQAEVMWLAQVAGTNPPCDFGMSTVDLNDDWSVNFEDFAIQMQNWLKTKMFPEDF